MDVQARVEILIQIFTVIAWPATVLILVFAFKDQIETLLARMEGPVKLGPWLEARLAELDSQAKSQGAQSQSPGSVQPVPAIPQPPVGEDPRVFVGEAAMLLTCALLDAGRGVGVIATEGNRTSLGSMAEYLFDRHIISLKTLELLREVQRLRDVAVRTPGLTHEQAMAFGETANTVIQVVFADVQRYSEQNSAKPRVSLKNQNPG